MRLWNNYYNLIEIKDEPKKEIDWAKIPSGTLVEVRDDIEDSWKEFSFAFCLKESEYPFITFNEDLENNYFGWKYCRIKGEIKDEWLTSL